MENIQHQHLEAAFCARLRPIMRELAIEVNTSSLGKGWIALGMFMLELYIPDKPIDPAAAQRCSMEFLRQQEGDLLEEINLHTRWEAHLTGNTTNSVLSQLSQDLTVVRGSIQKAGQSPHQARNDVLRVHAFWKEVSRFLEQVLSPPKIALLVDALDAGDPHAASQEQVLQESIAGFSQRLEVGYADLRDVSMPLQSALLHIRKGLRLVAVSAHITINGNRRKLARFANHLSTFPTIKGAELLAMEAPAGNLEELTALQMLLLNLAATSTELSKGTALQDRIPSLEIAYEQILGLWLIDRAKEKEQNLEAGSLYRRQKHDYDAATEAEIEEREFLELFPTFEDSLQSGGSDASHTKNHPSLVEQGQIQSLVSLHLSIFANSIHHGASFGSFDLARMSALTTIVDSSADMLPDTLDLESAALQFSVMHRSLLTTHVAPIPYNFYYDPNIPEVGKASRLIQGIADRLQELICEWPEQMVLQHLLQRCQSMLVLTLDSSVAKILSALEQLLLQSEDWERYANRHNTLKTYREELIALIVQWRRMELSCWQTLLQDQAQQFEDQTSDWWFRLFEACIRGPLSTVREDDGRNQEELTTYLDELVPLLDDLLTTSPIGQYRRRLDLLSSFVALLYHLQKSKTDPAKEVLNRVRLILQSTLDFYQQFNGKIAMSLSDQRGLLEKDIRKFIKLASWKDVNVQALKASATRTHHQLYKTIRKFRDVMRQPCVPHLRVESLSNSDLQSQGPIDGLIPNRVETPMQDEGPVLKLLKTHRTSRIADLSQTFSRFNDVLNLRLRKSSHARMPRHLDELAGDIIITAKSLATTTIPADIPATKREQHQKNLLTRKRKAWSDLLKELKRIGFAANVKPEVLDRQRSRRWLWEQPALDGNDPLSGQADAYYYRLLALLPELRNAAADHNADILTRDIQRIIAFVESGLTLALDVRSW